MMCTKLIFMPNNLRFKTVIIMHNYENLRVAMNHTPFWQWSYFGFIAVDNYGDSNCACGHKIKFEHIFHRGEEELIIGSTCAKLFPDYQFAEAVQKLTKDTTKSFRCEGTLIILQSKGIINDWEYRFYFDTCRKRKLSVKQLNHRIRINTKILTFFKHYRSE